MTRWHRSAHRLIWPALTLAVGLGLALALAWRPPEAPSAVQERPR